MACKTGEAAIFEPLHCMLQAPDCHQTVGLVQPNISNLNSTVFMTDNCCTLCAISRYEQLQYDEQQLAYEVQLQQQLQQLQRGNYEGELQTFGGPSTSEVGMSSVEIAQAARLEREINGELLGLVFKAQPCFWKTFVWSGTFRHGKVPKATPVKRCSHSVPHFLCIYANASAGCGFM